MRKIAVLALVAAVVAGSAGEPGSKEEPKMPAAQKEHDWLKQLAGEWETEAEMLMEPGKPPVKSKGTESTSMLGGFWAFSVYKGDCMGTPMTGHMTVGYDPKSKKYVGTWVCSLCDWLCKYEGTAKDKVLTLECEGPSPATGKTVRMRDVIELKDKDTKLLTSTMKTEDGKWVTFMTMTARRKK